MLRAPKRGEQVTPRPAASCGDNGPMATDFLVRHGYFVLFAVLLAEQIGLPLPAVPFLLGAGALAGMGKLNIASAVGVALLSSALSDAFWFELGRRRGGKVLRHLCRLSLQPDSCVRRTEDTFARRGPNTLLVAKFVPGLNTVAPPLAGVIGMNRLRFHFLSGLGSLFWSGSWMLVGWIFRHQLDRIARAASVIGIRVGLVFALLFVAWLGYKWEQRRRFLRDLWVTRITPAELKTLLDAGEDLVVVDLRGRLEFEADPVLIPGALRRDPQALEATDPGIPRDREVVLYCT